MVDVVYTGFDADHFCFRVEGTGVKGIDMIYAQKEMTDWLFENTDNKWFMGNQWPYGDYPKITVVDPSKKDVFVLFSSINDALAFEETFATKGIQISELRKNKFFE